MKYKYEFEADDSFEKGDCYSCPFGEREVFSGDVHCVLGYVHLECPLEEAEVIK